MNEGAATPSEPHEPSLFDAVLPVVVLIGLISTSVLLFGTDATGGPLQVALLLSAAFAGLMALKNGHTFAQIREAAIGGVASAMGAIFILLAVGALIGTWNMAGTIPTLVSYGIALLSAKWFFVATLIVCSAVGVVTGSSWTTAGTIGVAFVGIAGALGLPAPVAAGAVISGAYFGDKMSPLSETTILVPQLVGDVPVTEHIRAMIWTSGPAYAISLLVFIVLGLVTPTQGAVDVSMAQAALAKAFDISIFSLLPLIVLLVLTIRKVPPFLTILGSALFAGIQATITQPAAVSSFVGRPELGPVTTSVAAIFSAMANGYVSTTGVPAIDDLFSRGGMAGMLTTVWIILGALSFAAIMESAGFLRRLISPIVVRARSNGGLIVAVVATAIGLNIVAGDQYVADVMPSRAFRDEFQRRGLSRHVLTRAVEDSGTVTSALVPWNSCGAYMSGVLGVPTSAYLPFAVFNLASPIIEVLFGLLSIHMDRAKPADAGGGEGRTGAVMTADETSHR